MHRIRPQANWLRHDELHRPLDGLRNSLHGHASPTGAEQQDRRYDFSRSCRQLRPHQTFHAPLREDDAQLVREYHTLRGDFTSVNQQVKRRRCARRSATTRTKRTARPCTSCKEPSAGRISFGGDQSARFERIAWAARSSDTWTRYASFGSALGRDTQLPHHTFTLLRVAVKFDYLQDVLAVLDRHHPAGASLRQAEQLSQHFYAGKKSFLFANTLHDLPFS